MLNRRLETLPDLTSICTWDGEDKPRLDAVSSSMDIPLLPLPLWLPLSVRLCTSVFVSKESNDLYNTTVFTFWTCSSTNSSEDNASWKTADSSASDDILSSSWLLLYLGISF